MTPTAIQALLLVVSVLLSALVTVLITQIAGLRGDLRSVLAEQKNINDRLIKIETQHGERVCMTNHSAARA